LVDEAVAAYRTHDRVVVADSKLYRGRLRLDACGMLWYGRHLLVSTLRKTRWEADQADEILGIADLQIPAIVAVHGAGVPWGQIQADGVTVVPALRVPGLLRALPPILGPERVAWLAGRARLRSAPALKLVGVSRQLQRCRPASRGSSPSWTPKRPWTTKAYSSSLWGVWSGVPAPVAGWVLGQAERAGALGLRPAMLQPSDQARRPALVPVFLRSS
jgi:hypothetical protein